MTRYLHDIPLPDAQARLQAALEAAGLWGMLGGEEIPVDEHALGRVTATPVWARLSSPHYHAAAMDGFAVRADATSGAQPSSPISFRVYAPLTPLPGEAPPSTERFAAYVDTGDPLPDWADAVIPTENVELLDGRGRALPDGSDPHSIRIRSTLTAWSHVRLLGEDIVATQLVLPAGHRLRPVDLGAVAASGHSRILVSRTPRVAILPTGSELVPVGADPGPGEILEYNSIVLAAQVRTYGGVATRLPPIRDDLELIAATVLKAAQEYDLILLNAGSSAGAEDFSSKVIGRLGEVLVHGVAVRPGHPVILGMIDRPGVPHDGPARIPIVGVPGYPVSAALTLEIFVEPLIARWLGRPPASLESATATLARKIVSPAGDDDFVRVALGLVGDELLAAPLSRGAGVITSLVQADGLAILPRGIQGSAAGDRVVVRLLRSRAEIEAAILCIGSHDLTLDLLAQALAARGRRLVTSNAGSQGGLLALNRRHAHVAGSHLFHAETGTFNLPYVRQFLPGVPTRLITLVHREQGLLVARGNPKSIRSLEDLQRPDVYLVNRQTGAGTRVLLDHHLGIRGIRPESIRGYNQELYTHLNVAAAIAAGRADCGLGIRAAASALGLDFVPLFRERYDLVIPLEHASGPLLAPLLQVLTDPMFRHEVAALPGYDVGEMGRIVSED